MPKSQLFNLTLNTKMISSSYRGKLEKKVEVLREKLADMEDLAREEKRKDLAARELEPM